MTQWEYRIVPIRMIAGFESAASELNILGENGWELVSLQPDRGDLLATFKRPRASALTMERETTRRSRVA
jgi:hypothetical protein